MRYVLILFLAIIIVSFSTNSLHSQFIKNYGIQIGITSANQEYSGSAFPLAEIDLKRRLGFLGGFQIEWLDVSYISIITQIEYIQKGMGIEGIVTGQNSPEPLGTRTDYSRLDYLSLPVLLRLSLIHRPITPYVIAGPRYDYLLNYDSSEFMNYVFDNFRRGVYGGAIGIGIESNFPKLIKLTLELRYNLDFTDSLKLEGKESKNNTFDLRVGYYFN